MKAGNTVETLRAVDVNDAAPARGLPEEPVVVAEVPVFDTDLSEVVSREEFEELRDAFLRLLDRIVKFNLGAPHRI